MLHSVLKEQRSMPALQNEATIRIMTKSLETIYFPAASLKELISFNEKVGINLPEEEVKKRYRLFGGVFRALTYDPAQYSENLNTLEASAQDLQQIDRAEYFLSIQHSVPLLTKESLVID